MAEYIERDSIKYEQWSVGPLCAPLMIVRKKTIDSIPAADVVEVVRCKDCKHWHEDDDIGHCDNPDGLDNYAEPNDFCSYGERKNDDDNI